MSSEKIEHVNLYFKNNDSREELFKNTNPYEKYIITMNESIQIENRELKERVKDLEYELQERVEEIDTYDVSKRYTKGLLKNLVELEKLRAQIAKNNEESYKKIEEFIKNKKKISDKYTNIYNFFIIILLYLVYQFNGINFIINSQFVVEMTVFLLTYHIFTFNYTYMKINQKIPSFENSENIDLELKIKKITDSQDFLSDYIDNI
jgi:hypothetical protein